MSQNGYGSIDDLLPKQKVNFTPTIGGMTAAVQPVLAPGSQTQVVATSLANDVVAQQTDETSAEFKVAEKMEDVRLGAAEEEARERASQAGLNYIDLSGFPIGPDVIALIPEAQSKAHHVVAFFKEGDQIRIGVVDPTDPKLTDIEQQVRMENEASHIVRYVISQHSFEIASKIYKAVVHVKEVEYGIHITPEQLKQYQATITTFDQLNAALAQANMTEAFAMLIAMALQINSSDIHIESQADGAIIRYRVDGILTEAAHMTPEQQPHLVSRIKAIAELKLNVTSVPQDGRISIIYGDDELDIRVSTLPSAFGESIVMRLLQSTSISLTFADLGLRPAAAKLLQIEMAKPNGMIITTGPTGSGKTTTLYAMLNTLNEPGTKIITLENPVEYKLQGIVQSQVEASQHYSFAQGLRAILRQDPDIVMVGEIRDQETAKTAVDAALTGHLVLSTIHTNDAAGVVPRFMGMGVEGVFLAPALNAVIGQRLVRRLCLACRAAITPAAEVLRQATEWLSTIPPNAGETVPAIDAITWYGAVGCDACHHTGYKGRVGIYEVFTMSAAIEQEILSQQVSEYRMKELLHAIGMVTMGQDGVLKAAEGLTTLEEVFRVAKE